MKILFIGDIVGPGLDWLETHLPGIAAEHQPDFIVANAENMELSGTSSFVIAGMSRAGLARLWTLGVDAVTGGNHSWDGPEGMAVHEDNRVLRPLNYGTEAPGRGAGLIEKRGMTLGVVNLAGRDALRLVDDPLAALDAQLEAWGTAADGVLVDFHGASTEDKLTTAFAGAGRICAVVGTHTHVRTADAQVLPGGVAYVSDVGMTGPSGGILGYDPQKFVAAMRARHYSDAAWQFASGPVELGAVLITCESGRATAIQRL
ncbi:MAG: YmdB family metallophosphoesterase [Pleurocapsa minor GSE-CHR-MK-17-07R]|jgi:metallophosphoesterase (TIGR00282 family)|nr:YmdB family metallophosphoesterase [Pleurocapsa minor GSE-CHR-MK 17-07R]